MKNWAVLLSSVLGNILLAGLVALLGVGCTA